MERLAEAPRPDAVLAAFGLKGTAVDMARVGRAWSNRVYRLTTDDSSFAVKQLRNPWDDPRWRQWLAEAWRFERRAHAAGLTMPEPIVRPQDGECLAWVETVSGTEKVPVRLHRWVDGLPAPLSPVDEDVARWAGRLLATLHGWAIVAEDRSIFPVPDCTTADQWSELVDAAQRRKASWASSLADQTTTVEAIACLARAAPRPESEVMSHGDLDQKNIVLGGSGPVLCDWDVAAPLVPRQELADVAMSLAGWSNAGVARQVVAAYRAAGGAAFTLAPSDLGVSLMSGLDWLAFNVERAIGTRPAEPAEEALGDQLVPDLLTALPGQVATALDAERVSLTLTSTLRRCRVRRLHRAPVNRASSRPARG